MKRNLSSLAAALIGAVSLWPLVAGAKEAAVPVQLRIELDRPVLPAGGPQRAVVKVALDCARLPRPEQRAPVNLTLVLDRSGSMRGEKIEHAREAAIEAVRRLAPDDVFSLVIFDHEVETLVPACRVGDRRDLEQCIRSIRARGNTAIYGGVSQGAAELRKHLEDRRYTHRLILLSDGLANVGPRSPDDFARLGVALGREGVSVSTVGVGLDYNEDMMTRLAQTCDGNTYFVASSGDLPTIFDAELGDVLSVVARRAVVTIEFPAHVRPLSFVGREGVIRGQSAEFSLNQLYGGREKFALVEVEVDSTGAGEEREIAKAKLVYENALTRRPANAEARSSARFTTVEREVIASANQKVQADYAANLTVVAKDEALRHADANERAAAAQALRSRNDTLKKMGETYNNVAVMSVVAKNAAEADRLEREGLDNVQRKTYRAENAQTSAQQSSSYARP